MFSDFLKIRDLDRFRKIGRYSQLVGALMTVVPLLSAIMSILTGENGPNPVLDPLPGFSPTGLVDRHPLWVAEACAPLGIVAIVIGTRFLSKRPSARLAMSLLCWVGFCLCLFLATLFGLSIFYLTGFPVIAGFAVVGVLTFCYFALILYRVTRYLMSLEILAEFGEQHA